ncbi:MAG: hypothetical protein ACP5JV_11605 [Thermus sp.]|uniref:hypothetical protein n=2 Tax=Thermus sp. TaxID=275 RepID=UPI003D13774C
MGHTHYWELDLKAKEGVLRRLPDIALDFQRLLPHLPPLAGPDGTGNPTVSPEGIAFNGPLPHHYESLVFPGDLEEPAWREPWERRGRSFGFCKTGPDRARKRPYDLAVRTLLLLAKVHLGGLMGVYSDAPLADWAEAALLIEGTLALPVDLYGLLGAGLLEVEDAKGRRFLVERWGGEESELQDWLRARERMDREGLFPWPFRGPYRVLGEVKVPQEELPGLWRREGFYRGVS